MQSLDEKAKTYLSKICSLTNCESVNKSQDEITFSVEQRDFISSFREMEKKYGPFKAYPVETKLGVSQIDAVWQMGKNQHIVFSTDLTDNGNGPRFYVTLLNAPSYIPGPAAQQLAQTIRAVEALQKTPQWQTLNSKPQNLVQQVKALQDTQEWKNLEKRSSANKKSFKP